MFLGVEQVGIGGAHTYAFSVGYMHCSGVVFHPSVHVQSGVSDDTHGVGQGVFCPVTDGSHYIR